MKIINIIGGLGNQMFQYAFALSLKNKTKEEVKIDISSFNGYELHNGYEINKIFHKNLKICSNKERKKISYNGKEFTQKLKRKIFKIEKNEYFEQDFSYNKNLNYTKKYFIGYWQSEKYFNEIKEEIKKKFKFPEIKDNKNMIILNKIKSNNSVSIHIRRGDYINHPIHGGICDIAYYKKAIKYIKTNVKDPIMYIFSDDIKWCKENLYLSDANYINWNQGEDSFRDMQLMSECKHNIIANSSFSWWGAWLNNNVNKIVIAPSKWFNDKNMDTKDLLPKEWRRIHVE